jgi:hypothetical protein
LSARDGVGAHFIAERALSQKENQSILVAGKRKPRRLAATVAALSTSLICIAGLINLAPAMGAVSSKRLQAMYGIAFEEPNLVVLMRHRAILLGVVGALLGASAFLVSLRPAAYAIGFASMLSFVLIAWLVGDYNKALRRVILADLFASAALLSAALIDFLS